MKEELVIMDIVSLNNTLAALKIPAFCKDMQHNRHFQYFDLELKPNFKVKKLISSAQEIALNLKSDSIPIFHCLPQEGIVRMEVVAGKPLPVYLIDLWQVSKPPEDFFLPCLLGISNQNLPVWMDISQNPHLLIAGASGSGKSVALHNILANLFCQSRVKIYLSDCKLVEFAQYSNNPQVFQITSTYIETCIMLEGLIDEMERRYIWLSQQGIKSIVDTIFIDPIVVMMDEVADLMSQDKSGRLEQAIVKLTAKSRASGIYLILATQRPSIKILTGNIKANCLARLSCKVSSNVDSRVILDTMGAEHLIGKGDALFRSPSQDLTRLQIALP